MEEQDGGAAHRHLIGAQEEERNKVKRDWANHSDGNCIEYVVCTQLIGAAHFFKLCRRLPLGTAKHPCQMLDKKQAYTHTRLPILGRDLALAGPHLRDSSIAVLIRSDVIATTGVMGTPGEWAHLEW